MIKENFCSPCLLAIPAALGVGGTAYATTETAANQKKYKNIILWSSIVLTIISIIIFIWWKSQCKTCR